jgi:hypothetical protein
MCSSYQHHVGETEAIAAAQEAVELVERCVLTVVDPSLFNNLAAYAAAAQSASPQQNVATAQNINSPNSFTAVSSTSG